MLNVKRILVLALALLLLCACLAESDGFSAPYTYNYDYWEDVRESPDAYEVKRVLYSATLGLENSPIRRPQSLFVKGDTLYVCDTGNNRILVLNDIYGDVQVEIIDSFTMDKAFVDPDYRAVGENRISLEKQEQAEEAAILAAGGEIEEEPVYLDEQGNVIEIEDEFEDVSSVDEFLSSIPLTFLTPSDISVDDAGNLYIADKNNFRVVVIDSQRHFLKEYTRPDDSTFDQGANFLPNRLVTDCSGRVYALADNVNKGIAKFEADTTFTGFIGANKVTVGMFEYIWKYFFLTDEQRAQTESVVPTRYENICIDPEGFIYATNTVFSEYDLKWDNAKPIRRINGIGDDILIKNDRYPPIGDYQWVEGTNNVDYGPSKFVDITVLEDDIYVAFDTTRGRLFGYDSQGVMLWAFGGKGNYEGAFLNPITIEHMGRDLICLDQNDNAITIFTPTEYGNLIYAANSAYIRGDYDGSADTWREVLRFNANYNMAFRGIGRALLRQGDYREAMDYFEMAHDRPNYGRAFRLYRKDWVEKNIWWVIGALLVLIAVSLTFRISKKIKMEVATYERDHVAK